ncbi:MAG: SET domain-containing protein-lysine N-methyltransferase [Chlamydiota bacterium]
MKHDSYHNPSSLFSALQDLTQVFPVVPIFKKNNLLASTKEEYKKRLGVTYTFFLEFASEATCKQVKKQVHRALIAGHISREQKWLGAFFHQEIVEQRLPPLSIHWIEHLEFGVFAEEGLLQNTFVGEYTGSLRKKSRKNDEKNGYGFEYVIGDRETNYTIDAKDYGNHTRFINHAQEGNCVSKLIFHEGIMRVILVTARDIQKGEQLTYDYGAEYWENREESSVPQLAIPRRNRAFSSI